MSRQSEARQSEDAVLWVLVLQNGSILQYHTTAFLQEFQIVLCRQIYGILVSLQLMLQTLLHSTNSMTVVIQGALECYAFASNKG